MTVLDALVPMASILLGAGITYFINVRGRRRNYVEDLFNEAIAAVATADASVDYPAGVGRPQHLTDEEYQELLKWMVAESLKNWASKRAAANEALARVLPHQPELASVMPFSPDVSDRRSGEVIAILKRGLAAL